MNKSIAELAYLAGLLDADGSIDIRLGKRKQFVLRAQIYNTHARVMDWLVAHFGGAVDKAGPKPKQGRWLQEYTWRCSGQEASDLLAAIEPFMQIKKERANLAIEAWANRQAADIRNRQRPVASSIIALREDYVRRMRILNCPRLFPHPDYIKGT